MSPGSANISIRYFPIILRGLFTDYSMISTSSLNNLCCVRSFLFQKGNFQQLPNNSELFRKHFLFSSLNKIYDKHAIFQNFFQYLYRNLLTILTFLTHFLNNEFLNYKLNICFLTRIFKIQKCIHKKKSSKMPNLHILGIHAESE